MNSDEVNYNNPVPNVNYITGARESFLISGRPHDHHAHSLHSPNCKQGQFQADGGGASIPHGLIQNITGIQGIDEPILSGEPIGSAMMCGPISVESELYDMGHPASYCSNPHCGHPRQHPRPHPRSYCGQKLPNTVPGGNNLLQIGALNNLAYPYPVHGNLSEQRAISNIDRYAHPYLPAGRPEGFHGEWGRGVYDSPHHVVTTRIMKPCLCGVPNCGGACGPFGKYARKHDEVRTEYNIKRTPYDGNVCASPAGFNGDGYRGQYAFMPSGYQYNSNHHPYDDGAREKYGVYTTDYETGPNTAHGPVVADHITGPIRDKNIIMAPGTFRTIQMPGQMSANAIMHNAFAMDHAVHPAHNTNNSHNTYSANCTPVDLMYKTPPQGVLQTNMSIFDNFIA